MTPQQRITNQSPKNNPVDKMTKGRGGTIGGGRIDAKTKPNTKPKNKPKNKNNVVLDNNKNIAKYQNVSIFDLPKFPTKTNACQFTPSDVYNAIQEYGNSRTQITECLLNNNVRIDTFFTLLGRYPEIREKYDRARAAKSRIYGDMAVSSLEMLPSDPRLYQTDRESGEQVLTSAGAKLIEARAKMYVTQAAAHETGSYVPASRQDVNQRTMAANFNINIDAELPDGFDITRSDPSDLLNAIRSTRHGQDYKNDI